MIKVGKPRGLIRFASYNSIKDGVQRLFTSRVAGYSIVLLALVTVLGFSLSTRSDVDTTVLKIPGTLYQRSDDGYITNLYNIEFVNKTFDDLELDLRVESPATAELRKVSRKPVVVPAEGLLKDVYFIRIPANDVQNARTVVSIGVFQGQRKLETVKVKFIGPVSKASDMKR